MDGYVEVRVIPKAQQGAPRWIDATFDAGPTNPPRRFYVGASTWAVGQRHAFAAGGIDGHISHMHGGPAARVGDASILIRNNSDAPLRVSARRVEWLASGSCEVPSEVRERPRLAGLTVGNGEVQAPEVVVPATASSTVTV